MQYNMIFDFEKAFREAKKIVYVDSGNGRKHPIFVFENGSGGYIFEVRYGGATANALQRGMWTDTKRAKAYFTSVTGGWINYTLNEELVKLIMLALNSTEEAHIKANDLLQVGIDELKKNGE